MSGFLFLVAFGFLIAGIIKWLTEDAKENAHHTHEHPLTVTLKRGQTTMDVRFAYRDGDTEFLMDARRTINEWGAKTEITTITPEHYQLLDKLLGEALAGYAPKVIRIAPVSGLPPAPLEIRPTKTKAELLREDLMGAVDCTKTAIEVLRTVEQDAEVAPFILKGRSVGQHIRDVRDEEADGLDDLVKRKLVGLFHDPSRVR
jgi:hypothetical protein